MLKQIVIYILILLVSNIVLAQNSNIPKDRILSDEELLFTLTANNSNLENVYGFRDKNDIDESLKALAYYFKEKLSEKYLFNWKVFDKKFKEYYKLYRTEIDNHSRRANEQMSEFPSSAKWMLPMLDNNGVEVTAYRLRHLARQHKSVDIALDYFAKDKQSSHLDYFINQVKSLNHAFTNNEYDDAGNGIYESFRCGYRVINWLFVHNAFLSSDKYEWKDQILLIKTLLHHGAQLYKRTAKFSSGNHHTKGLVALFFISVLFEEFNETDLWREQALNGIKLHLQKEVNADGFQFERSIHYHKGDIDNYFLVYQLAKINKIILPEEFVRKFLLMFDALMKLSQPDHRVPVLQDDTDEPWAEFNTIDRVMLMGYIITNNSSYLRFTDQDIPSDLFWIIDSKDFNVSSEDQNEILTTSTELEYTGYYIMRNGGNKKNLHMVISAGKSDIKPDHQHGDMLGVTAFGFGNQLLPNYQVRYFLPDYEFFKNSWVKNVAIVDSIPQGRTWIPNTGGSGFGKWGSLPNPKTLSWSINDDYDYYAGTHDGYESNGVNYTREILFIKDGFWIVRDNFITDTFHSYQQIWQGNYDRLNNNHFRSAFSNGSGLEILQIKEADFKVSSLQFRGKSCAYFSKNDQKEFSFLTLLYPYRHFDLRIESDSNKTISLYGWEFQRGGQIQLSSDLILNTQSSAITQKKEKTFILIECSDFKLNDLQIKSSNPVTLYLRVEDEKLFITMLTPYNQSLSFNKQQEVMKENEIKSKTLEKIELKPAETFIISILK